MDVQGLERHLRRVAGRRGSMPDPQVLITAPGWEFRFGDQDAPFHGASVGKVMTATLIAMLVEACQLELDAPLGKVLPAADTDGLPAAPGLSVAEHVTVEHLLTHTSGLPDYFEPGRGRHTAASVKTALADRDRRWTPAELLHEVHGLPPVGRPGERFAYGDTGYVLLGRVAEEVTGESFAALLRERIYAPAGMERASTPYSDARVPADLDALDVAPFWVGREEASRALAVSLDWAGGGIVATPADFLAFQEALHDGRFVTPGMLAWMARPRHRLRPGIHYGAGLVTLRFGGFSPFLRGLPEPVGGLGAFATHLFFYPEQRAHVVLNFHSTRQMARSVRTHIQIARLIARQGAVRAVV